MEIVGWEVLELGVGERVVGVGIEGNVDKVIRGGEVVGDEGVEMGVGRWEVEGWGGVVEEGVEGKEGGLGVVEVERVVGKWGVEGCGDGYVGEDVW